MKKSLLSLTFCVILILSFGNVEKASAGHIPCDYNYAGAKGHATNHAANGGGSHAHYTGPGEESFDVPANIKNCLQWIFDVYYPVDYWVVAVYAWLDPIPPTTGPTVTTTMRGLIAHENSNPPSAVTYVDNATLNYTSSYVADSTDNEIPGTRGVVNFMGATTDNMGRIDVDQSKGRSHTVSIDVTKLQPGLNRVCIQSTFEGARNGVTIGDLIPASNCTTLELTSPAPVTRYNNTPNVTTPTSVAEPGDTINFALFVNNSGNGNNPYALSLHARNPDSLVFTPVCPAPGFISSAGCRWNNATTPPNPGPGATIGPYNYRFTVSPSAPEGSTYCFNASVEPGAGESSPTPSVDEPPPDHLDPTPPCITISRSRHPYVDTEGGDVHAGARYGEPCLLSPTTPRTISGVTNGMIGSKGQYIISASGEVINSGIRRFGSSNSASGNALTFGNSGPLGSYGEICRPDLAGQLLNDPNVNPVDPGLFGILSGLGLPLINLITPLPNNLASKYTGNVALIGSPLGLPLFGGETLAKGQRKTLVVDGDVFIVGDIKRSTTGYTSMQSVPSFAVIATGNIYISPEVRELYGIFYAGGEINTCSLLGINPPITIPLGAVPCSLPLQINGSLFARRILFRRTRGGVESFASNVHAERVTFQPGLMLNPPPGFGDFLTNVIYKGDLPPAY